ncbi:ribbon-helix-helix domain-containing protein [Kiloniella laminariae]|uniref:Ribbon-helix-helix domain-containing protein n=1 Tax=Kiloniella laminariae TaxID=454162 RepID=A0ABT4LM35_9PROT|nr:ribbon-helix-helix domain-containing protein [Kiloniella laminariae]MCZ4282185.1 ribbon-helix-helix domain-containing protein [Kiloniella laminariae]
MTRKKDNISFLSQSRQGLREEMGQLAGKSGLTLKNVVVSGRRTSLRLEPMMWDALLEIGVREGLTLNEICSLVEGRRVQSSLTAAIRVFTLSYFRTAAQEKQGWAPFSLSEFPLNVKPKTSP